MTGSTQDLKAVEEYVVKPIKDEDLERCIDIWSASFGFYDRIRWRSFFEKFLDEKLGVYQGDYLVSIAGIIHFQMWLGNTLVPCGGISAVACDPAFRRRGLIRKCLKECLISLHNKRVPVSTLWPFSYPFYARMGYSVSDFRYVVRARLSTLPDLGDSSGFKPLALDSYQALKPVHEEWIRSFNLSLKRSNQQWIRLMHNPQRDTGVYFDGDSYMLLNTRVKKERTLEVVEWAYNDRQSFLNGLSLLRRMDDLHYDFVEWTTSDLNEILSFGITEPQMEISYKPGVMARIVHTGAFLEALDIEPEPFYVDDPLSVSGSHLADSNSACCRLDPGQIVQHVTGALKCDETLPISDSLAFKKPFCVEFF